MNNIELYEFLTEGEPKRPCRDGWFFPRIESFLFLPLAAGRQGRREAGRRAGSRQAAGSEGVGTPYT